MRIAIVHPYPVSSRAVGGTTRIWLLVEHLAGRHELRVLTHASGDQRADREAIAELARLGVEQRVLERPRASTTRKLSWALGAHPYFVGYNRNPALEAALCELDAQGGLDVVHVEFAYLAPLLEGLGPRPARVLAEQETMSVMIDRLRAVPAHSRSIYQRYLARQLAGVRRFEGEALRGFDRAFAINPGEAAALARLAGRPVDVLPHVVRAASFSPPQQEPADASLLFVGNYAHDPNRHAIHWLAEHVWPAVRSALPGVRLDVVGPHLPDDERAALVAQGAQVLGRVEDLAGAYRRAAVVVNPIRSGGGMRGKVLEAFASGRPVVSTWLGMEGIAAEDGVHFDLADEPERFAAAVVALLRDPERRRALGQRARDLVLRLYDAPVVLGRLEQAFAEAVDERRTRLAGRVA